MQGNDTDAAIRTSDFSCACRHADKTEANQAGRGLNKEETMVVMMIAMPEIWRHFRFDQLLLLRNSERLASDCFFFFLIELM